MKRNILVFALIAIFALTLSSCGKKEKTNTEKLCIEKGWVLKAATVTPAVPVGEGTTNDWFADYLYGYEQDDIIIFNANGGQTINPGNKTPDEEQDGYIESKASTWKFNNDETSLEFQIPFFYNLDEIPARTFDPEFETATISKLTETELVLIYKRNINFAKNGVEYTWTLTYAPAK